MQNTEQIVELAFVVSSDAEANALAAQLQSRLADIASVHIASLSIDDIPGAVSSRKVIVAIIGFTVNLANGVLGSAIYDAMRGSPDAQCVVGEKALTAEEAKDPVKLDARVRNSAKSAPGVGHPH